MNKVLPLRDTHVRARFRQRFQGGDRRGLTGQVENLEKELIAEALRQARGNQSQAATLLDTSLRILGYKIKRYGLEPRQYRALPR